MTSTNLPLKYVAMSKVGLGYDEPSLERLMRLDPAFIGADAGSNDVGPYQLAGVSPYLSETACTRDLRGALLAARAAGVPFLVGSCGGSGRDWGVDWFADIIRRVAKEEGLRPFKLARIYTEVDPATIIEKLRAGAVKPLEPHIPYDEEIVRRSVRIVAVIGAEPFMAALESGADVVLAGRACDTAIFAAVPLRAGVPAPAAWFASKTAEAGYGAQVPSKSEPTLLSVDNDGFTVEPGALRSVCTVASVASAGLHEESDPTRFIQPGGVIDASQARYEAVDHRTVRVSGASFVPRRYTIKLEGVERAGYQSIVMVSYRDPVALESLKEWVADLPAQYHKHIERTFGHEIHDKYTITTRVYGQNGTMADRDPGQGPPHEVFFLIDVVANDQPTATAIAEVVWHSTIHVECAGWTGGTTTAAWPLTPPTTDRGAVYRWNVNHVVEVDDPLELCRIELEDVGS